MNVAVCMFFDRRGVVIERLSQRNGPHADGRNRIPQTGTRKKQERLLRALAGLKSSLYTVNDVRMETLFGGLGG